MRFGLWLCFFAALAVMSGCGALEPRPIPEFRTLVRVEGDPGQVIAGARVAYRKREVGVTDSAGRVELALKGTEGQIFELDVSCPEGYRSPTEPLNVKVRRLADPKSVPEFRVQCAPALRTLVVAVRAIGGPGLPVVVLGRERTRTDASGAAHVVLQSPPEQALQIKLDTSSMQDLRPRNPVATIHVADMDELVVFEQKFERERPPPRRRTGRVITGPTRL